MPEGIDTKNIFKALAFAAEKHRSQHRKGWQHVPYINHPIEVARLITDIGEVTNNGCIQAAFLHDILEDTDTTENEIEHLFGKNVLNLIMELTDDKSLPSDKQKELQLITASALSPLAKTIRIADKIANITDMMTYPIWWSKRKKTNYLSWANEVVKACADANPKLAAHFFKLYEKYHSELA